MKQRQWMRKKKGGGFNPCGSEGPQYNFDDIGAAIEQGQPMALASEGEGEEDELPLCYSSDEDMQGDGPPSMADSDDEDTGSEGGESDSTMATSKSW